MGFVAQLSAGVTVSTTTNYGVRSQIPAKRSAVIRDQSKTTQSCLKLNPLTGVFTPTSVKLVEERWTHLCWDVEGEGGPTLIIGGTGSPRSTELVTSDGLSSSANFSLQYDAE